jgi:hypothetical protein
MSVTYPCLHFEDKTTMRKQSKSISFRLPNDLHQKLAEQGKATGLSVGMVSRSIVVGSLMGEEIEHRDRLQELSEMVSEISKLQQVTSKQLYYLLYSILVHVGEIPTTEAKEIVRKELVKRGVAT